MKCTICQHQYSKEIGLALQEGRRRKEVAERYGLSPAALANHIRKHSAREPKPDPIPGFANLANRVEWMYKQSAETYDSAKAGDDSDTQFKALQRLEKHVEMQSKIVGLIQSGKSAGGEEADLRLQINQMLEFLNKTADSTAPAHEILRTTFAEFVRQFEKKEL